MTDNKLGAERAQRILSVLAMPRTVPIMRYMHMNGWFTAQRLCEALDIKRDELYEHLEAIEDVGLVEKRSNNNGEIEKMAPCSDQEFRLRREIPEVNLAKIAAEDGPFLKSVKFYSNLIFRALDKSNELDKCLGSELKHKVLSANGWHDTKAKAVLSCFDIRDGAPGTYHNFKRMVAEGVLGKEDIEVLKKVALAMIVELIRCVEHRTDKNISRLLIRVASQEVVSEFKDEIEGFELLEELPRDYFRQI